MKRLLVISCLCFVGMAAHAVPAVVDYVYDGDTFTGQVILSPDILVDVRVRLRNIDTPEIKGQCEAEKKMAKQARQVLRDLIPRGTIVDLQKIKDDKYLGRIDANVILPDGRDVATILIKQGLGRLYKGGKRQTWCK